MRAVMDTEAFLCCSARLHVQRRFILQFLPEVMKLVLPLFSCSKLRVLLLHCLPFLPEVMKIRLHQCCYRRFHALLLYIHPFSAEASSLRKTPWISHRFHAQLLFILPFLQVVPMTVFQELRPFRWHALLLPIPESMRAATAISLRGLLS